MEIRNQEDDVRNPNWSYRFLGWNDTQRPAGRLRLMWNSASCVLGRDELAVEYRHESHQWKDHHQDGLWIDAPAGYVAGEGEGVKHLTSVASYPVVNDKNDCWLSSCMFFYATFLWRQCWTSMTEVKEWNRSIRRKHDISEQGRNQIGTGIHEGVTRRTTI